ncbi:unnamed protein product [Sphenostylis stenocarpa]|uniref:Uncharacterized protein n=1 Tax=Sphenostylis stenocarpa TaxID=92480 RepID=A0AA86T347_9FABA|nr:unnamed protein product [Sphenostylis stenocarpa]
MKVRFLALILLIAGIEAISTSEFNMNFTSDGKGLIQSNEQAQQLLGKLQGNIEDSKYIVDENGYEKEETVDTTRKTQGGGSSGGSGSSGRAGGGGSADVNRRPRQSSAPSQSHFWVSMFNLSVNLAFVIFFPFHYV